MYIVSWKGVEIARSDRAISLEGALYFPPAAVREELLVVSTESSFCEWKGAHAEYFDIQANEQCNRGAVWRYPKLDNPGLYDIIGWYSFWRGVDVEWSGDGAAKVSELAYVLPNVAKALGVSGVAWRAQPPFLQSDDLFTGYVIPALNIAVDVLAEPSSDRRTAVINQARQRARQCVAYAERRKSYGDYGYGYIAVWGSATPPDDVVGILREGGSVLMLEDEPEQVQ